MGDTREAEMSNVASGSSPPTRFITVVDADKASSSYKISVSAEGKLPLHSIRSTFGMADVELADRPGIILSYDAHGYNYDVPFKFGDTVHIRGVDTPGGRPLTAEMLEEQLRPIRQGVDQLGPKRTSRVETLVAGALAVATAALIVFGWLPV